MAASLLQKTAYRKSTYQHVDVSLLHPRIASPYNKHHQQIMHLQKAQTHHKRTNLKTKKKQQRSVLVQKTHLFIFGAKKQSKKP